MPALGEEQRILLHQPGLAVLEGEDLGVEALERGLHVAQKVGEHRVAEDGSTAAAAAAAPAASGGLGLLGSDVLEESSYRV